MKTQAIELWRRSYLLGLIKSEMDAGVKLKVDIDELLDGYFSSDQLQDKVMNLFGETEAHHFTIKAYCDGQSELAAFDKAIASLEARRIKVLREIEQRRITVARRLKAVAEQLQAEAAATPTSSSAGVQSRPANDDDKPGADEKPGQE
jgi:hypothetical protein